MTSAGIRVVVVFASGEYRVTSPVVADLCSNLPSVGREEHFMYIVQ